MKIQRLIMRIFDFCFAIIVGILIIPIILITMLVIKIASPELPVLFKQKCLGYRCKPFYICKLRMMTNERGTNGGLLSDEQLQVGHRDNSRDLQEEMADRAVLQVDKVEPVDQDLSRDKRERRDGADMGLARPFPDGRLQIKFLSKVKIGLAEITARFREHLMGRSHLMELLSVDWKTKAKPSDWNVSRQLEFFGVNLLYDIFIRYNYYFIILENI